MSGFERGPGRSLAEHVDQAIEAAFADQRLVGAVVLVAHRGQWLYRRAAGLADREPAGQWARTACSAWPR